LLVNTTQRPPSPLSLFRFAKGETQNSLASKAGVARETVSRLERGATPQGRTAAAIADALGIAEDLIFPPQESR
jgi:transcriptional regulator with XRE-family HTH domain